MLEQLRNALAVLDVKEGEVPPVVDFNLFFEGNGEEESIAPNGWGYGRPPIHEMYSRFKTIALRTDVHQILVGLHHEWNDAEYADTYPPAGNVHIFTSAGREDVEQWIDGLGADGVVVGWAQGQPVNAPALPPGDVVYSVCWD